MAENTEELIAAGEARELLGVSRGKMAKLLASETLQTFKDPLDERVTLVRRADVEALLVRSRSSKEAAA